MTTSTAGPLARRLALAVLVASLAAFALWNGSRDEAGPTRAGFCEPPQVVADLPLVRADEQPISVGFRLVGPLEGAVGMTQLPSGPLLVVTREGRLWQVADGAPPLELLDLSSEIESSHLEQGLLGVAVSPDTSHLYLHGTFRDGTARVVEYPMLDGALDPAGRRDVLVVQDPAPTHNGGRIAFGADGMLYIALGDGGDGALTGAAQDLGSPFGKLLRIDPRPDGAAAYTIPDDNPFVGVAGARAEVWAYGFRNPWGWSFDRETGALWVGDVGQVCFEELDVALDGGAGRNFGWSHLEGAHEFRGPILGEGGVPDTAIEVPDLGPVPEGLTMPILEVPHSGSVCGIIGGFVYRGKEIPELTGTYVWADLCEQVVRTLRPDGDGWRGGQLDGPVPPGVVAFGEGTDGELYLVSMAEGVVRVTGP